MTCLSQKILSFTCIFVTMVICGMFVLEKTGVGECGIFVEGNIINICVCGLPSGTYLTVNK